MGGDHLVETLEEYMSEFLGSDSEAGSEHRALLGERGIAQDLMVRNPLLGGSVEWGEDREGEQTYYAHIDFQRRVLGISEAFGPTWVLRVKLLGGWSFEEQDDCPHVME